MNPLTLPIASSRLGVPLAVLALFATPLVAQEPDVTFGPPASGIAAVHRVAPEHFAPNVPQPPQALQNRESPHPHPTLPVGTDFGVPQPDNAPTATVDPAIEDAGLFRFYQNTLCNPAGSRSPRTPEPSSATLRDTVIQTGNWHAGISPDNGESWINVSPYTFFPASDGGFCCDQQAIDVQSHGFAMWLLQYSTGTDGNNRYRFAIANSRDKLRSASSGNWYYYDINAQMFGYASGSWLDYPDVAIDSTWLYCRANVIGPGESVIFRLHLDELATGTGTPYEYYKSSSIGGWSHRLAKGAGSSLMAFAALRSTTQIDVYTWPTASGSGVTRSTRAIASFTNTGASVPGPDGRDWAGFWNATGQIQGAYGTATECGFSWGCSPQTGRAMPYTRVARFQLSDRSLLGEYDIFNSTYAFLYGDMMSNSLGDVGGVLAIGSASMYVTCCNYIVDSYDPWPPATVSIQASGSSGPNVNRFGDFFTVRRHPLSPATWISNGSSCPDPDHGDHRFIWFGRDDYEPTWVYVSVATSGPSSASITMDVTDLDGLKNGSTSFTRRFAPSQGYMLTAPQTVVSGSTWEFERWQLRVAPTGTYVDYPIGERTLDVSTCGALDDSAIAVYKLRRILTVQSANPASGVPIGVSPADLTGATDGNTTFTRRYRDGNTVSLTAPATMGYNPFRRWYLDGVGMALGQTTLNVTMSASRTALADYWQNVAGSVATLGTGCVGSNGLVPSHTATWPSGQQGPQQGSPTYYRLANARPLAGCAINLGLSNTVWGGFRLPLDLTLIGANGCWFYHDYQLSFATTTDSRGGAVFTIPWPVNSSAVGAHVYTSYVIIDPGAPRPNPLTFSNALDTLIGGNI